MSEQAITVEIVSENSLLIRCGTTIDVRLPLFIADLTRHLQDKLGRLISELVPAYTSLLVITDEQQVNIFSFQEKVEQAILAWKSQNPEKNITSSIANSSLVKIPVYYGEEVAPELEHIANNTALDTDEVIQLHHQPIYVVFTLGFAPGFAYMGKVDVRIAEPRLATPREKVVKGSVGIADLQTGIYPQNSPGGWNIIGRTPKKMWHIDSNCNLLCPLKAGDKVKFFPIDRHEFLDLGGELQ